MTKQEYAEYEEAVSLFLQDFEDGSPPSCREECEPFFSWRPCECCKSPLGGDRHEVVGWVRGARAAGFDEDMKWIGHVCGDCVYYFEYGRLDDLTMLEMEGG